MVEEKVVQEVVIVRPTDKVAMLGVITALIIAVVAVLVLGYVTVVDQVQDCCGDSQQRTEQQIHVHTTDNGINTEYTPYNPYARYRS